MNIKVSWGYILSLLCFIFILLDKMSMIIFLYFVIIFMCFSFGGTYMKKVCITGYGVKGPDIENARDFKVILEEGQCTLKTIDHPYQNNQIVVGILNQDFKEVLGKNLARLPRAARVVIAAACEAIEMANLHSKDTFCHQTGIVIGSSGGVIEEIEWVIKSALLDNFRYLRPTSIGNMNNNSISTAVASFFQIHGPCFTICNSCTSSIDAILLGKMLIETGQVECCLVGGVDTTICDIVLGGFSKLKLLLKDSDNRENCGPFGQGDMFSLSEGGGVLVLESEEHAIKRGANILGYIKRGAMSQDALSIYHSDSTGRYMLDIVKKVVDNEPITYVNSQALGIKENDQIEQYVHEQLFDWQTPITSIKGMIGHPLGASGILQCISSLISFEYGFIPPTIHTSKFENAIPIVKNTIYQQVDQVLMTSHGYGGNNSCLLVSRKI